MDRNSGCNPGKKWVDTHNRSGVDGPCAVGLGGYFTDHHTATLEGRSQGRRGHPDPDNRGWGEREMQWRHSKRGMPEPEHIKAQGHAGLQYKGEPDNITGRPFFVQRKGNHIVHHHAKQLPPTSDDFEAERFQIGHAKKTANRARQKAISEDRREKAMVSGLETWEKTHLGRMGGRSSHGVGGLGQSFSATSLGQSQTIAGATNMKPSASARSIDLSAFRGT